MLKIDPKKHPKLVRVLNLICSICKVLACVCFSLFIVVCAFYSFRSCERGEMISASAEEASTPSATAELAPEDYNYYVIFPQGFAFHTDNERMASINGLGYYSFLNNDYLVQGESVVLMSYFFMYYLSSFSTGFNSMYSVIFDTTDYYNFTFYKETYMPIQMVNYNWLADYFTFDNEGYATYSVAVDEKLFTFTALDGTGSYEVYSSNNVILRGRRVPKDISLVGGVTQEELQQKYDEGFNDGFKKGYEDGSGGVKVNDSGNLTPSDYFYYIQLREGMPLTSYYIDSSDGISRDTDVRLSIGEYGPATLWMPPMGSVTDVIYFFSFDFNLQISNSYSSPTDYSPSLTLIPNTRNLTYTYYNVAADYWVPLNNVDYNWTNSLSFNSLGTAELTLDTGDGVFKLVTSQYGNVYFELGANSADLPMVDYKIQIRRVPKGVVISGVDEGELQIKYDEGYSTGYTEGETVGKEEGQAIGYENGYSVGYQEGYDRGFSFTGVGGFDWLISSVQSFLNTEFFGDFGIGTLLYVGLGITLVTLFLKLFAGG